MLSVIEVAEFQKIARWKMRGGRQSVHVTYVTDRPPPQTLAIDATLDRTVT